MFSSMNRQMLAGAWVATLVVVAGAAALSRMPVTAGTSQLWFLACVAPPSVMLLVWRGAPPPTVAEIPSCRRRAPLSRCDHEGR